MKLTYSAGGVVIGPQGKVLVVSQHGISWSLPKGHIDPGENARMAASREIKEESGITQLRFIKDLGHYQRYRMGKSVTEEDQSELKNIQLFLYETPETKLQPLDKENPEARWVEPHEVTSLLTHPKDKAFYESILDEVQQHINKGRS